jgi:hypothetical protein
MAALGAWIIYREGNTMNHTKAVQQFVNELANVQGYINSVARERLRASVYTSFGFGKMSLSSLLEAQNATDASLNKIKDSFSTEFYEKTVFFLQIVRTITASRNKTALENMENYNFHIENLIYVISEEALNASLASEAPSTILTTM